MHRRGGGWPAASRVKAFQDPVVSDPPVLEDDGAGNPRFAADGGGNQHVVGGDRTENELVLKVPCADQAVLPRGGRGGAGGGAGNQRLVGAKRDENEVVSKVPCADQAVLPGGGRGGAGGGAGNQRLVGANRGEKEIVLKVPCEDQGGLPRGGLGGAGGGAEDNKRKREDPDDSIQDVSGIDIIFHGSSTPSKEKILNKLKKMGGTIDASIKRTDFVRISMNDVQVEAALESIQSDHEHQVRRRIFNEEMEFEKIFREHHKMFQCRLDLSKSIGLPQFADKMREFMVVEHVTPGAGIELVKNKSTNQAVKSTILKIYLLIKGLHRIGYTLSGNFNSLNFAVDQSMDTIDVRFAHLNHGSLLNSKPKDEDRDIDRFKEMVFWEIFTDDVIPPHDISYWLSLLGQKELQDLLPIHISLLEDQDAVNRFMSLYDAFAEMKSDVYKEVVRSLGDYNDWKNVIATGKGNDYLEKTIQHNQGSKQHKAYEDDAGGLLRLLRNCKNHEARSLLQDFIHVIADEFPNLLYDFQREMFCRGYKA